MRFLDTRNFVRIASVMSFTSTAEMLVGLAGVPHSGSWTGVEAPIVYVLPVPNVKGVKIMMLWMWEMTPFSRVERRNVASTGVVPEAAM